jgi:hypothetical protein
MKYITLINVIAPLILYFLARKLGESIEIQLICLMWFTMGAERLIERWTNK